MAAKKQANHPARTEQEVLQDYANACAQLGESEHIIYVHSDRCDKLHDRLAKLDQELEQVRSQKEKV